MKQNAHITILDNPEKETGIFLIGSPHIGTNSHYSKIKKVLSQCDHVLYEGVKKTKGGLKSKFIASNYSTFSGFFNGVAEHVDEQRKDGHNVLGKVVSQGKGIDYRNLPTNWERADISKDEIPVFSAHNLKGFLSLAAARALDKSESRLAKMAHDYVKSKSSPNKTKLASKRENKVYQKLSPLEENSAVSTVGILYGDNHFSNLENSLISRGYNVIERFEINSL